MKASEKRLLLIFTALLAVIGGFMLSGQLQSWDHLIDRQARALDLEKMEADALLQQAVMWRQKQEWLLKNQPHAESDFDADEGLTKTLNTKAMELGLEIVKPAQPLTPIKTAFASEHGVAMTVKGDLPAVFRWIYSVQSPSEFRVVSSVKVTPNKDDAAKADCVIEFWRWYRPVLANNTPAQ